MRYTGATVKELKGSPASGQVARLQVGIGLWVARGLLVKVEYVNQTTTGFGAGTAVDRLAVGLDPKFSGIISEVSVSF
ncbi:MAG: hypothetical protein IID13_10640 [Candidatus Marinimicrobia bacterium]|nr:hypothetical protein [Candidatus Neomarinimicrobiota bacterium]